MSRFLRIGTLSLASLVLFTFVFGRTAPKDPPKADDSIHAKLNKFVAYKGVDDPKVTLGEELDALAALYNLTLDINTRAFREATLLEPARAILAEAEPIRPLRNVRLETVLLKILERVPCESGATFVIRRDRLEITTVKAQQAEFYPALALNPLGVDEIVLPVFPLIHANFGKTPLDEALKELADRNDVAIVLDVTAVEEDKPIVTAKFVNTPLDTAVKLLAEMSDLRSVTMGKTIFVTTAEKAKRLHKEQQPKIVPMPGGFGVMGNIGGGMIGFGGGKAGGM